MILRFVDFLTLPVFVSTYLARRMLGVFLLEPQLRCAVFCLQLRPNSVCIALHRSGNFHPMKAINRFRQSERVACTLLAVLLLWTGIIALKHHHPIDETEIHENSCALCMILVPYLVFFNLLLLLFSLIPLAGVPSTSFLKEKRPLFTCSCLIRAPPEPFR